MTKNKMNSLRVPPYRDAGFDLENAEITKKAFAEELNHPHSPEYYIYSRYRNPSTVAVEKQLMKLEDCKWSLLVETGMAAIDMAVSLFQKGQQTRPWLFFNEIYGGTNSFIDRVLVPRRGLDIHRFYADGGAYDYQKLESQVAQIKPEFIFFEAVSNPMLIVADVALIMQIAKKYGAKVIVDNTFGTPMLWKPLADGADLVIHSATKYLGGHGNITAGVLSGNDDHLLKEAIEYRKWAGHFLSPDDAYRLGTQLKTFELRFTQHCNTALELAGLLQKHPKIEEVLYPGLEMHPTHAEAHKLFKGKGYGGMITFSLKAGTDKERDNMCNALIKKLRGKINLVPTLGEADTILLPVDAVWGMKYPKPGVIRLSVGIEDTNYIIKLITSALSEI